MYNKTKSYTLSDFFAFHYRVYKRSSWQLQYSANTYSKRPAARHCSTTGSGAQKQENILLMESWNPRRNYLSYL